MSRALAIPLCFVLGVLALWQGLVMGLGIPEYLLPAPLVIVETLGRVGAVYDRASDRQ